MSLIFIPKIAESYKKVFSFGSGKKGPKVKVISREVILWPKNDLNKLVNLRAIGVTYKACGVILGRSANSCGSAIQTNNLYSAVQTKRNQLIKEALNDAKREVSNIKKGE